jgi:integrase
VTLAEARERAAEWRRLLRQGIDPLVQREGEAARRKAEAQAQAARAKTFRQVAELYLTAHEAEWRSARLRQLWRSTLTTYAFPHLGDLPVADVATAHVMAALEPIWWKKPETASRVRARIEAVLDYARASGWRTGENPARWRGHLTELLPERSKVAAVQHHAALPWKAVGAFMADLRGRDGVVARALEFAILTAARTGEVLGARWREIDLADATWIVPAERMKMQREHRVPLPATAAGILRTMAPLRPADDEAGGAFVFPGQKSGRPLSGMAFLMTLRRMGRDDLTAHGFRSTFRDWVAERTSYPNEVAEAALAHVVKNETEAAYRRGDLFEKRRKLMEAWAAFCAKPLAEGGTVTLFRKAV